MSTRIVIEGILVETPQLRETPNGVKVTTLRILDNPARRVNGEWKQIATTAYEVDVWGKMAEMVAVEFTDRDLVTVTAYNVYTRAWESTQTGKLGADIKATAESVAKRFRPVQATAAAPENTPASEPAPAPAKPAAKRSTTKKPAAKASA